MTHHLHFFFVLSIQLEDHVVSVLSDLTNASKHRKPSMIYTTQSQKGVQKNWPSSLPITPVRTFRKLSSKYTWIVCRLVRPGHRDERRGIQQDQSDTPHHVSGKRNRIAKRHLAIQSGLQIWRELQNHSDSHHNLVARINPSKLIGPCRNCSNLILILAD